MTKRKTKTTLAEASAPADLGKAAAAETAAQRPKKSREKVAPAITPAAETATETPSAAPAQKRTKSAQLSALDAAAKVLAETGQPMTCQDMIDAMAKKGYWTSPGGRTPAATLYSAILRELKTKGAEGRFQKIERGKFAHA